MDWSAIFLTFKLALVVCALLLLIGMPIASWLCFSEWRHKYFVESIVALPLVLPPTVLGFYVLVALGSQSPLGRWYQSLSGHALPFTFAGLVIASVIYSLPFAVQPMTAAFAQVDVNLINASATLGASRLRTFVRIVLPLSVTGVVTGAVLSFAHTLGEFGVVLMVGGNIPGVTQTVSIAIYDRVQALDYAGANRMALLLMAFSFVALSITYGLNRRTWVAWPIPR
ncbi:MAG: molybdate ABC transporter permease subunit [Candidatus Binatus sp.]|uniref:molybdate ABC transporter permease subunit n=1 Tax=Candidatus Binatus sp. TaxID=2811406 RepID=UPI002728E049|nr:molybdate ABC transporter permease subunit [Candidatus Binatus sp.]MDO8430936.1 molybdate ABC transporter permease subunit [Candidatus Binatus sp.]